MTELEANCRSNYAFDPEKKERRRVGLIYDDRMCKHTTPREENHPESPNRIRVIWDLLNASGIAKRCLIFNGKEASDNHLALVHTKFHIDLIKNISTCNYSESRRKRIAANFNSIYFNHGSSQAAYLAAGSVVEVAEKVAKGELDSAFAIVRPPGHHAEENEPMGFCLYNNVAVATRFLLNERPELGIKKILIVDWDVHHGNGTQNMFYKDPRVLFFSVHRHEFGTFYPAGVDGSYIMTGEGPGAGYNINVPWENGRCGDADYLSVWDHVLLPVAKEFCPDIVIVSAGFDAAIGDPLGGCRVSPYGYSVMLHKLMEFAGGKIVMAFEGGYNLISIANSAKACVEVLLDHKPIKGSLEAYPFESTWRVIQAVRGQIGAYWPILAVNLPDCVTSKRTPFVDISSSDSDGEIESTPHTVSEEIQSIEDVLPLKNLKVNEDGQDFWIMAGMSVAEIARAKVTARKEHEVAQRANRAIPPNLGDGARDLTTKVDPVAGVRASAGGEVVVPPCPDAHQGERPVIPTKKVVMVEAESREVPAEGGALAEKKRKGPATPPPIAKKARAPAKPKVAAAAGTDPSRVVETSILTQSQGFDLFVNTEEGSCHTEMWKALGKVLLQGEDAKFVDKLSWTQAEKLEHQHLTQFLALRSHRERLAYQDRDNFFKLQREVGRRGPELMNAKKNLEEARAELAEVLKNNDAMAVKCQLSDSRVMSLEGEVDALGKTHEEVLGALSKVEGERAQAEAEVARLRAVCQNLLDGAKSARAEARAKAVAEALRSVDYKVSVATRELEGQEKGFQLAVGQINHLRGFVPGFDTSALDFLKSETLEPVVEKDGEVVDEEPGEFALVFEDFDKELEIKVGGGPYQSPVLEGEDPFRALE